MGDILEVIPSISNFEKEEHVVAAAQHIARLLRNHRKADDELRRILTELDAKLADMNILPGEAIVNDFELFNKTRDGQLRSAEARIKCWLSNDELGWDSEPIAFQEYLKDIGDVQSLVRDAMNNSSKTGKGSNNNKNLKFLHQAENILHSAMEKLEDELKDILSNCCFLTCGVVAASTSSFSEEDKVLNSMSSGTSAEDESTSTSNMGSSRRASIESDQQYVADIVRSDMVPIIRSVAKVMFESNYSHEFCEVFTECQREALDGFLIDLGVERFSIEEVIRMDLNQLVGKIRTWVRAIKTFISVYLTAEKRLCDQIFEEFEERTQSVFVDIANPSISIFLTFGQGVANSPRAPEKLYSLLNMYEALSGLQEDMTYLFVDISSEWQELLTTLGESAKATFIEFGHIILSNPSTDPFPAGGVHPITKYVVNYVKTLEVYTYTLDSLLKDDSSEAKLGRLNLDEDDEDQDPPQLQSCSPFAHHLRSTVDNLEQNLTRKSQLYRDVSLGHLFLLNNTHYIVQKMRGSELRPYLGDTWIRQKKSSYFQHSNMYDRASWSSVLDLLKIEGSASSIKKNALKDQLKSFTSAFEEIYKTQTGWLVRDDQLKNELRIKIMQKLILAYQNFYRRCKDHNLENYIKYEPDDLTNLISDLFEGSTKSLTYMYRR